MAVSDDVGCCSEMSPLSHTIGTTWARITTLDSEQNLSYDNAQQAGHCGQLLQHDQRLVTVLDFPPRCLLRAQQRLATTTTHTASLRRPACSIAHSSASRREWLPCALRVHRGSDQHASIRSELRCRRGPIAGLLCGWHHAQLLRCCQPYPRYASLPAELGVERQGAAAA